MEKEFRLQEFGICIQVKKYEEEENFINKKFEKQLSAEEVIAVILFYQLLSSLCFLVSYSAVNQFLDMKYKESFKGQKELVSIANIFVEMCQGRGLELALLTKIII